MPPTCSVFIATVLAGEGCGYARFMASVDALVMGRASFDTVRGFPDWPYGDKPVYVLSASMTAVTAGTPPTVPLRLLSSQAWPFGFVQSRYAVGVPRA